MSSENTKNELPSWGDVVWLTFAILGLAALAQNPRHDGGDARSRRGRGDEEGGGEEQKACEIHGSLPTSDKVPVSIDRTGPSRH